jgi:cysteine-rich repeat protein
MSSGSLIREVLARSWFLLPKCKLVAALMFPASVGGCADAFGLTAGKTSTEAGSEETGISSDAPTSLVEPSTSSTTTAGTGIDSDESTVQAETTASDSACGNGVVEDDEQCDDSNEVNGDGCQTTCTNTLATTIATGLNHTCVLLYGGTVRCWGAAAGGKLGNGATEDLGDDEPVSDVPLTDVGGTVRALALGNYHTCALLETDKVRCWGQAASGALGYGNDEGIGDDEAPFAAGDVPVGGGVHGIALGDIFSCARLEGGSVRCWGDNTDGQLGRGNETIVGDDETPESVGDIDLGGTAMSIAAGGNHVCAVLARGKIRCWGHGDYGELGYGNYFDVGDDETPSEVGDVGLVGNVVQVSAGRTHTCARLDTGAVKCWGSATNGVLGYGNTEALGDDETLQFLEDVALGVEAAYITSGGTHNCILTAGGDIMCWGRGVEGQLGYGKTENIGDDESPDTKGSVDVGGPAVAISAGGNHTCALLVDGTLRCWGDGSYGVLGYGNTATIGDDEAPSTQPGVPYH